MARSAAALHRVGQLASWNYLPPLCIRGHFEKLLSPCEDGYLQKMILLKRSLRHLCGISVSPSRNSSVVMKLMLDSDTSQCNILMPCYIHPSCNGSRSGGSPKQLTLSGFGALQAMLRMSTIENPHSYQTQTISLVTINELEGLNDCLRAKFVSKVAQQVDAPDLAYYFFRWAGRQTLFHKNINTHHSISEILGGPGKLDIQVQQQLLQVMCSRNWSACTSAFQAENIVQSGYYECYGYARGLTSKLVIGLGMPRKLLSGEHWRALHVGAGSSVRACQGNLIVTKELGKLGSHERITLGKGKVRIRGKERLRREVGILAKILRSKKTWGAKTAKLLKDSNVEVLPYHVCEVLRVHHNPVDKALKFFKWAKQQKRCKRGNFMFTKIIKLLRDAGKFDEIWPLLDDMKKEGRVIHPSMFLGVIRSYVQVKKLDEAMATFHTMEKYGCQPNTLIFNCMIDIFRKVGDVAKVEELFKNMDRVSCAPDIYTFSMLIDCKGKCGDVDTAFDLFQEMHNKGYKANVFTYSSLIDSLGKAGRFAEACNLLRGMKINGCDPNDVTYTTLIGRLGQAGQASLAYFYYEEMLSLGFVPTPVTYAVVIACTIQLDKETEAHSLFHIAVLRNKFSEFDVLKSVLGRLCKSGHWEAALKFFEDVKKNGVEPSIGAYDVLIHHLPKTGNVSKAFDIFQEISGKGACPDLVALTSLTRGLVKEQKLSAAMDVIQYMTKQGLSADIYMYGNLVNFLCQSGRFNDAFQVVMEEMKERRCPPNVHTYNKLIDNLGKAGRVHEAWEAFERMGQQDCAPDAVTYNTVIGILGNVGKVDTAHHLFKQMKEKGLEPTKYTYNIMIGILAKAGQAELGAELFKEMVENHIAPSEVTHKVLLQAHDETLGGYNDLLNECKKGMVNLHDSAPTDAGGSQHIEIEPCTSRQ